MTDVFNAAETTIPVFCPAGALPLCAIEGAGLVTAGSTGLFSALGLGAVSRLTERAEVLAAGDFGALGRSSLVSHHTATTDASTTAAPRMIPFLFVVRGS